ncbi:MAG: DNA-directed RNA polymerase subunit A' [Nanoarchaeota archaeon]
MRKMPEEYVYKKVEAISFSLLSPQIIKKMAAVKIVTAELYDKEGYPVDGGLMDIKFGVIDPGLRCKTCGGKLKECTGHFGYIELARPVIHVKYVKPILDVLRSICKNCGRLLVAQDKLKEHTTLIEQIEKEKNISAARKKAVDKFVSNIKGTKKCVYCNAKQGNIKLEKPTTFIEDGIRLTPTEIRTRFERVPDEDIMNLGLNPQHTRPEWMILSLLPVPPVTVRPSITLETGERSEDDLTHKLGDIVRINQRLFENINAGAPEVIVEDLWDLLQYHITTYFDNNIAQIPPARHRSGQQLKTLTERIKSKEGRFRYNLAGKRVNYAARTVISPDPKIELNEVGIPRVVAMELTIPQKVTAWNIKTLKRFIENGPSNYPGANYVVRPDGRKKQITKETQQQLLEELQLGYIVERHLVDGDIAIFNRQPSLHRMSIMCHKIKILPGNSFRLNPSTCTPYNADFDGDEMNLHIPQTEEAMAEAEILMQVQTQMITPKNGLNIVGCIEDAITGNYLLTKYGKFSKEEAYQLLISIGADVSRANFGKEVDGKEIFSVILPEDLDFMGNSKDGANVVIKNGKLAEGIIDQATIGEENGALIRAIYSKYREEIGLSVLGKIFRLGIAVLLNNGFTTGIADADLPRKVKGKCEEVVTEAEKMAQKLIYQYNAGTLSAMYGMSVEETLEVKMLELLNKARNKVGRIIAEVADKKNPTIIMALSGAQGKLLNLAQIAACVGQQALRGKRINIGYRKRTLSIFNPNDLSPRARGFIRRGYKYGLKPYEFFMHLMTGRDSLMDTALRTPKSGYLYRRLVNALQDLKVEYDYTVRDSNKNIVQFRYGDDGIDISKSYGGKLNVDKIVKEVTK